MMDQTNEQLCLHGFVSGRVQGVWYRGSTQKQARKLGITGWARNLPDGRVEFLICGAEAAVHQLEAWLHEGPPAAEVSGVEVEQVPWQEMEGFATR